MKNFKFQELRIFKKIRKNKANRKTSKIQHFFKNSNTLTTLPPDRFAYIAEGICKISVLLV